MNLLRSKMALVGDKNEDLAKLLKISSSAVSCKINGKTEFNRTDILKIIKKYKLTPEETTEIFFAEKVVDFNNL